MANTTKRELSNGGPFVPLWDGFPPEDETTPLHEFAFSASHHRNSERGRMAIARQEYGTAAGAEEGGY